MLWRLEGAGFILVWKRKQSLLRGLAGGIQHQLRTRRKREAALQAAAPRRQFPVGNIPKQLPRCAALRRGALLGKEALQFAFSTAPLSPLPPRNWLDAILRRAGWNSLQIAILFESTATSSNCASRKSVIDFFFFSFYFLKMKGFFLWERAVLDTFLNLKKLVLIINMACFDKFQN